jgi:hypothetical protein
MSLRSPWNFLFLLLTFSLLSISQSASPGPGGKGANEPDPNSKSTKSMLIEGEILAYKSINQDAATIAATVVEEIKNEDSKTDDTTLVIAQPQDLADVWVWRAVIAQIKIADSEADTCIHPQVGQDFQFSEMESLAVASTTMLENAPQAMSMVKDFATLFATEESIKPFGGTIKDQALIYAVFAYMKDNREIKDRKKISVIIPQSYPPGLLSTEVPTIIEQISQLLTKRHQMDESLQETKKKIAYAEAVLKSPKTPAEKDQAQTTKKENLERQKGCELSAVKLGACRK